MAFGAGVNGLLLFEALQEDLQLLQRQKPMRDFILQLPIHLRIRQLIALWFKHRVPPKVLPAPRAHNRALLHTLEQLHLLARPRAVRKRAHRLRRLVLEPRQHVVQALVADCLQEPLDVGPGQALERRERQRGVFNKNGPVEGRGRGKSFCGADLGDGSLDLDKIEGVAGELAFGAENVVGLAQLVSVA